MLSRSDLKKGAQMIQEIQAIWRSYLGIYQLINMVHNVDIWWNILKSYLKISTQKGVHKSLEEYQIILKLHLGSGAQTFLSS